MRKYVIITPARNEEKYIEGCIQSVLSQELKPVEWIIVSDRSTDGTDEVVERYAARYPFIKLVELPPGQGRDFASKVGAFNAGCGAISAKDYDYIGNLDADVTFEPDYFERLIEKFEADVRLGMAGGVILELIEKKYVKQMSSTNSVAGALQLFRRRCFEDVGGFIPIRYGGEDSAAEITARMKGWGVKAFEDLEVRHHRRVSGSAGIIRARFRCGILHYQLGYHPVFMLASAVYRMAERPYVAGSLLTFIGYCWAYVRRFERPVSPGFVRYLAKEQLSRLRSIFHLKFS